MEVEVKVEAKVEAKADTEAAVEVEVKEETARTLGYLYALRGPMSDARPRINVDVAKS